MALSRWNGLVVHQASGVAFVVSWMFPAQQYKLQRGIGGECEMNTTAASSKTAIIAAWYYKQ